jgi:hypothetical protein
LGRVVAQAREKGWISDEHFSVDGTLLEAWASGTVFSPKTRRVRDRRMMQDEESLCRAEQKRTRHAVFRPLYFVRSRQA